MQLSLPDLENKYALSFILLEIKLQVKCLTRSQVVDVGCVYSVMVLLNTKRMPAFATDKLFLFFLFCGRCGNSGKFSLPVILLAHNFEMFILARYALAVSAGGFVMII